MLEGDNETTAADSARQLDPDGFALHVHDPQRFVGRAIAAALPFGPRGPAARRPFAPTGSALGAPARTGDETVGGQGEAAWDIYLFYPPGPTWGDGPPEPAAWFHQLGGDPWADAARYRTGDSLRESLRRAAADLSC
jgi:hypothetical protein